ncbi:hypothetical protein KY366_08595, partial [Candidatus Woesearchaeota archaeon]|nr:hypothetical protein [Candidatus Woesearchaeota archaeon]
MAEEGLWDEPSSEPPTYVRFKGIWDMQDIYDTIADWCRKRKLKFHERVYKHKHPSPYGVERQYIWDATRIENEYIQFIYHIYVHTY